MGSSAANKLSELMVQALYNAGHLFAPQRDNLPEELPKLLTRYGIKNVQTREYQLEYAADLPGWEACVEDMTLTFRIVVPFLRKWTRVPSDYEEIYQQMLKDLHQPDFRAILNLKTVWGTK
jgi:nucleoside 2-deoxyribosyltransferase